VEKRAPRAHDLHWLLGQRQLVGIVPVAEAADGHVAAAATGVGYREQLPAGSLELSLDLARLAPDQEGVPTAASARRGGGGAFWKGLKVSSLEVSNF
jgi:hypothetical protein